MPVTCLHPTITFLPFQEHTNLLLSTLRMDPTLKFYPIEGNSQVKFDGSNAESNEVTASITTTQAGIERLQEGIMRSQDDVTNLGETTLLCLFFFFFSSLPDYLKNLLSSKSCSKGVSPKPSAAAGAPCTSLASLAPTTSALPRRPDTSESPIPPMLPLSMSFPSDHSCSSSTQPTSSTSSSSHPSSSSGSGGNTVPHTWEQSQQLQIQSQE